METVAGSRFGPYEVVSPLGAGSMGEVYRAKDARLHREVALKVLVGEAIGDAQKERRFLQEARAASALNHPNILTIFDVGTEDGTRYIVSELIDGESLRDVINQGPFTPKKFLDLAIQIADGLAAAHQSGIVHRDLKPENIMITREGRVKILDFGLAKPLLPLKGSDQEQTRSYLTGRGVILGTMAYMSPEQARGKEIDYRSDQFSFGAILYEMATGEKAFHRESALHTLTAILNDDPSPVVNLNPKFPALFRWLIERCLAKDPAERYASTVDLYHELRNFRNHLSEASFPTEPVPQLKASNRRRKYFLIALALAFISLITGFGIAIMQQPPARQDLMSYRYTPLATNDVLETGAAWSADGKSIAYSAEVNGVMQIFTRGIQSPSAAQITNSPGDCYGPVWSPDGTRVYYVAARKDQPGQTDLWIVGAAGGSPALVLENVYTAAISPDGKTLLFLRRVSANGMACSLWISSPVGATPRAFSKAPLAGKKFYKGVFSFSPNGAKVLAVLVPMDSTKTKSENWILNHPDGPPKRIEQDLPIDGGFSWMPDNRHLIVSGHYTDSTRTHLMMLDSQEGTIQPLTTGIDHEFAPAVSPDGNKIAFTSASVQYDLIEVPLDGSMIRNLTRTEKDSELGPAWSPQGNQFVYASDRTGPYVIWLRSSTEGWERPLVKAEDFGVEATQILSRPAFSPDGNRIAYHRGTSKGSEIWISNMMGGVPVKLHLEDRKQFCPTWSPDGNWIAYLFMNAGRYGLAKARIGGSETPRVLVEDTMYYQPQWAPAGDWISYQTSEGLHLVTPEGDNIRTLSKRSWLANGWSKDGTLIYGVRLNEWRHLVVASIDLQSGEEKIVSDLGASPLLAAEGSALIGFSLAPDGKSFATSIWRIKGDLWLLEGFQKPEGLFSSSFVKAH